MNGALEILVMLSGTAAVTLASLGVVVSVARRANRVSPRHRYRIPLVWMWSPAASAHLHRRLRHAVMSLRLAIPAPSRREVPTRLQELAADVETLAASTDQSLVRNRRAPWRERPARLGAAFGATQRVEGLSARLAAIAAELDPRTLGHQEWDRDADALDHALRTYESAIDEMRTCESAWVDDLLTAEPPARQGERP